MRIFGIFTAANASRAFSVLAISLFTLASVPAHAAPLITATIGTQTATSHTGYFVLDFGDTGANPQTYAFAWNYEGTKTDVDFLLALQSSLTGPNGFQQQGAQNNFITLLGYAGRTKFNDFAGSNSGEPFGYWNIWLGFDGQNWTNSQFGAADVTLSDTPTYTFSTFTGNNELTGASWHGWRWVPDYRVSYTDPLTPRTPQLAAASTAPEPGTLTLLATGAFAAAGVVRRRRRITAE